MQPEATPRLAYTPPPREYVSIYKRERSNFGTTCNRRNDPNYQSQNKNGLAEMQNNYNGPTRGPSPPFWKHNYSLNQSSESDDSDAHSSISFNRNSSTPNYSTNVARTRIEEQNMQCHE